MCWGTSLRFAHAQNLYNKELTLLCIKWHDCGLFISLHTYDSGILISLSLFHFSFHSYLLKESWMLMIDTHKKELYLSLLVSLQIICFLDHKQIGLSRNNLRSIRSFRFSPLMMRMRKHSWVWRKAFIMLTVKITVIHSFKLFWGITLDIIVSSRGGVWFQSWHSGGYIFSLLSYSSTRLYHYMLCIRLLDW